MATGKLVDDVKDDEDGDADVDDGDTLIPPIHDC